MQFIRRFLVVLFVLALLTIGGSSLFLKYYEDEIKQYAIESLNKKIRTPIDVKEVNLSLWNDFPRASLVFNEVVIHAVDAKNDTLLSARKLSAQFDLYELYQKNYHLSGLQIEDGKCNMMVDQSGRENYIFWEADSSSGDNFSLNLERVRLKNMQYDYQHLPNQIYINAFIECASLDGSFASSIFEMEVDAKFKKTNIKKENQYWIGNRNLNINSLVKVNSKSDRLDFQQSKLLLDGTEFDLEGYYEYQTESWLKLELHCPKADIEKAMQLSPKAVQKQLENFSLKGSASLRGSINGSFSNDNQPSYQAQFVVRDGYLKQKSSNLEFKDVQLEGLVNNGEKNNLESSQLAIKDFSCSSSNGPLKFTLDLKNFKTPEYDLNSSIKMSLKDLLSLAKDSSLKDISGNIEAEVSISGKLDQFKTYTLKDWKRATTNASIKLNKIGFLTAQLNSPIKNLSGELQFKNNFIETKLITFEVNQAPIEVKAKLNNLLAYVLDENQTLLVDASLKAEKLRLDDLIPTESSSKQSNNSITLYLNAEVGQLDYDKHSLKNFKGELFWNGERFDFRNTSFGFLDGRFEGDFFLKNLDQNNLKMFAKADVFQIDIQRLFKHFNNFDQDNIKSENLEGIAQASIDFAADLDDSSNIDLKTLQLKADVLIEKGKLMNYKPLENLSDYIELEELKEVQFQSLSNQLLIQNQTLFIPRFEVRSSALNLELEGSHTFNNEIDYQFELYLNDVLGKKVKKPENNEFGYVEDDGLGRTKIFLKMTGTVDDPIFGYDKQQLKGHIKEKVQEEKQTIKKILNEEFNWFKNDTTIKNQERSTSSPKSPFSVEWEESPKDSLKVKQERGKEQKKGSKKSKIGKFIDKIAQPNEEEYVEPIEN